MSAGNYWHLEGNLVADPEAGRSATSIARVRLAVNRYDFKTKTRIAEFYRITVFGDKAEFALKYFTKGSGVSCSGEMQINEWVDKAGQKRQDIDLIAREFDFPVKGGSGATGAGHTPSPGAVPFEDEDEEDPFKLV
jgi:single-strand DNA-binding protein